MESAGSQTRNAAHRSARHQHPGHGGHGALAACDLQDGTTLIIDAKQAGSLSSIRRFLVTHLGPRLLLPGSEGTCRRQAACLRSEDIRSKSIMVQRVTYRRRHSYATKSNATKILRTPGAV